MKPLQDPLASSSSHRSRSFIFITALIILGGFLLLNWFFIHSLKNHYREVTDKEARLYAIAISENIKISELNWVFAEILRKSKFPIVITDKFNKPVNWKNIQRSFFGLNGREISETTPYPQLPRVDQDYLINLVDKLDELNLPIKLARQDNIFGYFHYGEIGLINILSLMPLIEPAMLLVFFLFGYFFYQTIRSSERHLLWVALAKETAHQMGTPLSSLMGWVELLKVRLQNLPEPEKYLETLKEIDGDIARLTKVSIRFSQIGSLPKLELGDINVLVKTTLNYFSHRIPQFGKKIDIEIDLKELPKVSFNAELLGWVFENLIKNSLDSIQAKTGFIKFETHLDTHKKYVVISITDSGKGIEKENWKKIFQTGFSTKKRGWGLGLSLAKRIITIYHKGSIGVVWSDVNKGTQIQIVLPISEIKQEDA